MPPKNEKNNSRAEWLCETRPSNSVTAAPTKTMITHSSDNKRKNVGVAPQTRQETGVYDHSRG